MRVLGVEWLRALSLVCDVALRAFPAVVLGSVEIVQVTMKHDTFDAM